MYSAIVKFKDCNEWVYLSYLTEVGEELLVLESLQLLENTIDEMFEVMGITKNDCELIYTKAHPETQSMTSLNEEVEMPIDNEGNINVISLTDYYEMKKLPSNLKH